MGEGLGGIEKLEIDPEVEEMTPTGKAEATETIEEGAEKTEEVTTEEEAETQEIIVIGIERGREERPTLEDMS